MDINNNIDSRKDFIHFLKEFYSEYLKNGNNWENNDLNSFLEALSAYAGEIDGYYQNCKLDIENISPWKIVSDMLQGASIYE